MITDNSSWRRLAAGIMLPLIAAGMISTAHADPVSVDIRYSASITGLPVGKAKVGVRMSDGKYAISGSGKVSGISALFTDGKGSANVTGSIVDSRLQPDSYSHSFVDDKKESLDMTFSGARITEITLVEPPRTKKKKKKKKKNPRPSRVVPITDQHKRGVIDPLSAFLLPAAELTGEGVCNRTLPLFDGKQRFDVAMQYDRRVKRDGINVFVCSVRYMPIAGHKPHKKTVKFMANNKNIEVWLAPVGASGFVVPVEAHVKTQLGMLVIKAGAFRVGQ